MKIIFISIVGLLAASFGFAKQREAEVVDSQGPKVQIALLLDTSSSMDGLIVQAKTQLWKIVNSFAKVAKGDEVPSIEVALYEYGNSGLSIKDNYIRQISGLTTDLDEISKQLFSLKTGGGDEYCGAVIAQSLKELDWDKSSEVYKSIFIAGNEPFTQGKISATQSCQNAIAQGIVINTIHCGPEDAGINGGWKAGAITAEGDFLLINQDQVIVHIEAPQDELIIKLSSELNTTYIPYGAQGQSAAQNQHEQDSNAIANKKWGSSLSRALTKNSKLYNNATWDLVDLKESNPEQWNKLDKSELPKNMQNLTMEQIEEKVAEKTAQRLAIKNQITELNKQREAYVAEERKKLASSESSSLDEVMIETIHKQVLKNGFNLLN